jgi:hypothetical protein
MKYLFVSLVLLSTTCFAQDALKTKTVSDTILRMDRKLEMPSPFNSTKALLKLFPGKYANLSDKDYINDMINWTCPTCKSKEFPNENEDSPGGFPFSEGVATRLLNILSYKDSSGTQYKMLTFSHSEFDQDGVRTGRYIGGLMGLAKFKQVDSTWVMTFFQPAIGTYGAFSSCPKPELVMIGKDQYAFMLKSTNGPGGGPFYTTFYLIAGTGGAYQQILSAAGVEKTADEAPSSSWTAEYTVPESDKKYFRDIIVTVKGTFAAEDVEALPDAVRAVIKGKKTGKFMTEQRYVYKGSKGYEAQQPMKATLVN